MAINNYTGLQGSGKSYEVVSTVILSAVQAGRRVVTNIDGINPQAIYDYLVSKRKCRRDSLGEIVPVTNADVMKEDFFPDEEKPELVSVVRGGDLVAIDECWRFWSSDDKLLPNHMQFFRMHRHYVHPETGATCDLALMIQDVMTLHRKLRSVVEMTTRTVKLKAVGMPKRYRIEIYEGGKISARTKIDTYQKSYDPDIFPLYKSYSGDGAKEQAIDARQNILRNPRIFFTLGGSLCVLALSVWLVYRFFQPKTLPVKKTDTVSVANVSAAPAASVAGAGTAVATASASRSVSSDWRFVGRFEGAGKRVAVVADSFGRLRVESPSMFVWSGAGTSGRIDGQLVSYWSGSSFGVGRSLPPSPVPVGPGVQR